MGDSAMPDYNPSPELTKAVLDGIAAPLPFWVRIPLKAIPSSAKEKVVSGSLAHVIPASFATIASALDAGARVALTSHGELTEETKKSLISRIASWLAPDEVQVIRSELNKEVIRLAKEGFGNDAWQLTVQGNEVVHVVHRTSALKETYITVADALFDSFETLKGLKAKAFSYFKE
jgi:hypothetical protein